MKETRLVRSSIVALIVLPSALIAYKLLWLDYSLGDVMPRVKYTVTYDMAMDGHDGDVTIRTFLPSTDEHQTIADEQSAAIGFRHSDEQAGLNREASWTGGHVPEQTHVRYGFSAVLRGERYEIDPDLRVPPMYPASIGSYLRPEEDIQVDHSEIRAALAKAKADVGPIRERLRKIYDLTAAIPQRPFKGTTDALTALRLGEASCNGKGRLFVALARATGIPARLVGGLVLRAGRKRTSHQWVEAYVGGHWVPFDPTNRHFAELPEHYLVLYRGDEVLFRHTRDINFDYEFVTATAMVPSARAKESFQIFNVWALFDRMGLPFSLLRTLLMLPIGALVVVLFRNVIGLPTFGTFLPALLAAAATETGIVWGIAGIGIVMGSVAMVRAALHRLQLLHSPLLAIQLAAVVITMLGASLIAERLGLVSLARLSFFPIAVLAIAAERFYLALSEQGARRACRDLGGTLLVVMACFVLMNSLALQILLSGFPEILLFAVAGNLFLGRWVGMRLFEYFRFRHILREATA